MGKPVTPRVEALEESVDAIAGNMDSFDTRLSEVENSVLILQQYSEFIEQQLKAGAEADNPLGVYARVVKLEHRFEKLKAAVVAGLTSSERVQEEWDRFYQNPKLAGIRQKLGLA